jgi:hypothetical protein
MEGIGMELPVGLDYAWLACDAEGRVARFTNAGQGPIPVIVLASREFSDAADSLIRLLPFVGEHEMRVSLPDSSDFSELARRGIYGFDWQDTHRTTARTGCYEIVSRPMRPLWVEDLPPQLRQLAELVRIGSTHFEDSSTICITGLLNCVE